MSFEALHSASFFTMAMEQHGTSPGLIGQVVYESSINIINGPCSVIFFIAGGFQGDHDHGSELRSVLDFGAML